MGEVEWEGKGSEGREGREGRGGGVGIREMFDGEGR